MICLLRYVMSILIDMAKEHSTDEKLRVALAMKPINIPEKAFTQRHTCDESLSRLYS